MYYELTKSQKKIARQIIDKGLEEHYKRGLTDIQDIIDKWREGKYENTKKAYMEMFQRVKKNDNNIANIYNNKGGSRWLEIIYMQLVDGVITMNDVKDLGEEVCMVIRRVNGELF